MFNDSVNLNENTWFCRNAFADSGMFVIYYMNWVMTNGHTFPTSRDAVIQEIKTERVNIVAEILKDKRCCWKNKS